MLKRRFTRTQAFVLISCLFFVGYFSIFRSDFLYIDDMGRSWLGYRGWDDFARWMSYNGSVLFGFSRYLTDISPLTQILAIFFLSLSCNIIIFDVYEKKECSIFDVIAALSIGFYPYFLECISYRFDSPFIALSILFSLLPFIFKGKRYIFSVIICVAGMLMTYQAASGIYPVVVVAVMMHKLGEATTNNEIKEVVAFFLKSILGYTVGLIIYFLGIMKIFPPSPAYRSIEFPTIREFGSTILDNYYQFYQSLFHDFRRVWLLLIAIMVIGYVVINTIHYKRKKVVGFMISVVVILVYILLAFGLFPVIKGPLIACRSMYGPGVTIAVIGCCISNKFNIASFDKMHFTSIICIPYIVAACIVNYCFFSFSFTYGNALSIQKNYTDIRVMMLLDDLTHCDVIMNPDEYKQIQFVGSIGFAPGIQNMSVKYPIIQRLVPVHINNGWAWGYVSVLYLNAIPNMEQASDDLSQNEYPILVDSMLYTIKGDANNVVVYFK